ncbi:hypothetical protein [Microbacterium sp. NPDC096154]|uniref:hypothetical protein n=1 Tax=Microbacterium sp. NPDC096154 TaxID=3155549 RepID=UPI0033197463
MDIRHLFRDRIGRRVATAAVAATALVGAILVPVVVASSASAVTDLVVDSPAWGGSDADPGDGICATVELLGLGGHCTLRAAIEESNALNRPAGEVAITVSEELGTTSMVGITGVELYRMLGSAVSDEDTGAIFNVTAPVTIDLGHRLFVDASYDDAPESAAFYLNGPDIQLLNADRVLGAGGSSIVVGPDARDVVIDGGGAVVDTDEGYYPERFMVIREGVRGLTVRGYDVRGFYDSATSGGIFTFNSRSPYTAREDIVIEDVSVVHAASGTTCTASDGTGCRARLTNFWPFNGNNVTDGLAFRGLEVRNMTGQRGFAFASTQDWTGATSVRVSDLQIADSTFANNQGAGTGEANPFIMLPLGGRLTGETRISRNVFSRAASGQTYAIYYARGGALGDQAMANSTTASQTYIEDNHFDGYTDNTIRLFQVGVVTVKGNTFGTRTGSQARPAVAEEYSDSGVMLDNYSGIVNYNANQNIRTWAPSSAASVPQGPVPAGALRVEPAQAGMPMCTATVEVQRITATDSTSKAPGEPVTLDVFWTADDTAEILLGSVTGVTGTAATLALPLPVGPVALPDGTAQAVDPSSGDVSGRIRLQTQVEGLAQLESSQYSRLVDVTGDCRPAVALNQATTQNDATLARDLHFTLTSSMPLDPASVTADDFVVAATATPDTIDAARLNPRVGAVTEVAGSGGMEWDVVVRVDDSATVTVELPADAVIALSGLGNETSAAHTDNAVTFVNPLVAVPGVMDVIAGERYGETFALGTRSGAPVPDADLIFTATVSQPDGTPAVSLSETSPVIASGGAKTGEVTVTAAAGAVAAGTEATVSFAVSSDDADYDGLVAPRVHVMLYATDPAIRITKTAYVDVADPSSPESIEATGTLAPTGSRLTDRQAVCFVYTVTNASQDDWATRLTDITVADSDERLGENGVIATIPQLAQGETTKVSACTVLVPGDTTQSRTIPDAE